MGIIDNAKEVVNLVKEIDNIELYRKILDLQGELIEVVQENREIKAENASLKEKLAIKESLQFDGIKNVYWRKSIEGEKEGPFCSTCHDTKGLLVRMHYQNPAPGMGIVPYYLCHSCGISSEG